MSEFSVPSINSSLTRHLVQASYPHQETKKAIAEQDREQNQDGQSKEEQQKVSEMKQRDREVRAHEQAHLSALGGYRAGGPKFAFEQGPDGQRYAVSGEVPVDTSSEPTPEETIRKAQTIRRAALAPADPSPQDRAVAQQATQMGINARQELTSETPSGNGEPSNSTPRQNAIRSYRSCPSCQDKTCPSCTAQGSQTHLIA